MPHNSTLGLLVVPLAAHAQEPTRVPRIGVVSAGGDSDGWPIEIDAMRGSLLKALRQRSHELGYIEGHTILVEYRGAAGDLDRIPSLVADLVQRQVDVLVSP